MSTFEQTHPSASVTNQPGFRAQMAGVARLARPHQWVKNLAVLLVPAMTMSAGSVDAGRSLAAAAAFCLISSSVYILNDYVDIDRDRMHPTKRDRPLPSGIVSRRVAVAALTTFVVLATAIGALAGPAVLGALSLYVVINVAYCFRAKHVPVIDILCVSSGFVLRVITGAIAVHAVANPSLLGAVAAGSFALVAAKRRSELCRHAGDTVQRPVLRGYTIGSLDQVLLGASIVTVVLFLRSLSASVHGQLGSSLLALMVLTALAGLLRLLHIVQDSTNLKAEDPARLLFTDVVLRTIVLVTGILAFTAMVVSHGAQNA